MQCAIRVVDRQSLVYCPNRGGHREGVGTRYRGRGIEAHILTPSVVLQTQVSFSGDIHLSSGNSRKRGAVSRADANAGAKGGSAFGDGIARAVSDNHLSVSQHGQRRDCTGATAEQDPTIRQSGGSGAPSGDCDGAGVIALPEIQVCEVGSTQIIDNGGGEWTAEFAVRPNQFDVS